MNFTKCLNWRSNGYRNCRQLEQSELPELS
jgi:hypothetical protein